MVDEIVTRQELIDAKRDARDLGKAVNENVIVDPRYGEDFKSLPMIAAEAQATIGEWESAIALITQEGGVPALAVSDASGETQQQVNYNGGSKWYSRVGGYKLNERVVLDNGDIVKSTIDGNTNDPNVDMTGWVSPKKEAELHNKSFVTITDITKDKDITTALSSLGALGIKKIKIPSGDWEVNSALVISSDIEFDFDLDANIVIKSGGSLKFTGSSTKIASYSISVSTSSYILEGIDASGLQDGDMICLYDPTDFSFCNARDYYRKGEFIEVRKVLSETSVQLLSRPLYNYTSFDLYKIDPITVSFNRFNLINEAITPIPFLIDFGKDIVIKEYKNDTAVNSAITIQRSYNVEVENISPKNKSVASGNNYGLTISNCQLVRVFGGALQGTRHAISLGGMNAPCAIPTQQVKIIGCTLKYDGLTNVFAADMHGNVNFVEYINCTLDGAKMGGSNTKLVNCTIESRLSDNLTIFGSELAGGYHDIIDCTLILHGAPNPSQGYVHFALTYQLKSELNINIKNLTLLSDPDFDESVPVCRVQSAANQSYDTNIDINGLKTNAKRIGIALRCLGVDTVNGVSGVLKMGRCNLNDISIAQTGTAQSFYAYPDPTFINKGIVPNLNLPTQYGTVEASLTGQTTGVATTTVETLQYAYPQPPIVLATLSPPLGTLNNNSWLPELQNITVGSYENRADQVRFTLRSEKTMPTATVSVHWLTKI